MTGFSRRRLLLAAVICPAALAAAYGLFQLGLANTPPRAAQGFPAPTFSAVTLDSVPLPRSLADFRGAPLIINVWATWCDPCREEMPSFQRLYDTYRSQGLRIVAISVDDRGNEGLIREFAAEHALTFDILHARSDIMTEYQVRGVPQTFLISARGRIVGTRFPENWASPKNLALVDSLLLRPAAR